MYYWDMRPGYFVNQKTGEEKIFPFPGNTLEWYMTLLETIRDLDRKQMNSLASIIKVSPEMALVLENLPQFRSPSFAYSAYTEKFNIKYIGYISNVGFKDVNYSVYIDYYQKDDLIFIGATVLHEAVKVKGLPNYDQNK